MFLHLFKYKIKQLLHVRDLLIWTFLFPVILGTFFFMAFGKLIYNDNEEFVLKPIPIAIVAEEGSRNMEDIASGVTQSDGEALFIIQNTTMEEAKALLENGEIDGILVDRAKPEIMVDDQGMGQTILKSFVDTFLQYEDMVIQVQSSHPEALAKVIENMSAEITYNEEITLANTKMNGFSQYFYALIAMTCLYGAITGKRCVDAMQANLSALGMRREVSPANKMTVILADFCGAVCIIFASVVLLLFYLTVILKIDFGNRIGYILLTGLVGCIIGVAAGMFIGSIGTMQKGVKDSIVQMFALVSSFFSGLMYNGMKNLIEHNFPIFNRINPATVITDCLYSLNMYDSLDRFYRGIFTMLVMAGLLCIGSYLQLRRKKYASV